MSVFRILALLGVVPFLVPQSRAAAHADAAREARELRRQSQELRLTTYGFDGAPKVKSSLLLGLGRDQDQSGSRVYTSPFLLTCKTADEQWGVQIQGDGYSRIASPGSGSLSGMGDAKISVLHVFGEGLTWLVGLGIPTHGEVGSEHWSERAEIGFSRELSVTWSYYVSASISRLATGRADISRYSQLAYGELSYSLGARRTLFANLSRSRREGTRGSTDIGLGLDFPVAETLSWSASATRGLTSGLRHTGVEVDVIFRF